MKKQFKIGELYQVFNNNKGMSWNNYLKCVSRSGDHVSFVEIDERDNLCGGYNLSVHEKILGIKDSIEYCDITNGCIIQAD